MLTERQKLTVSRIADQGIIKPEDIIVWATKNLNRPHKRNHRHTPNAHVPGRAHGKLYYQQIVDHYK